MGTNAKSAPDPQDNSQGKIRNKYLIFSHAGVSEPGEDSYETGEFLVTRCLRKLAESDNPDLFPPKLFLLLVTPPYLEDGRDAKIFAGIQQTLLKGGYDRPALIGSSVAAVVFDGQMHPRGAVLVCLASRFLDVKVEAEDATKDPAAAMSSLAERLGVSPGLEDLSPGSNRSLLVFFPGIASGTIATDLHRHLLEAVQYKIPVFGGVGSAQVANSRPTWKSEPVQFDINGPHKKSVVAALLVAEFPIATNLTRGLRPTQRRVRVAAVTDDQRIHSLEGGISWKELDTREHGLVLLGKPDSKDGEVVGVSYDHEPPMTFLPVRVKEELVVLEADATEIVKASRTGVRDALRRSGVEKPEGCLVICCVGLLRNSAKIGLDFNHDIRAMQEIVRSNVVGAFLDGEAGVEISGLPVLTYWSTVRLVFGDELRDRSIVKIGHGALATHFANLATAKTLEETIETALHTVRDAGYAGAMISLIVGRDRDCSLVAQQPIGAAFKKVIGHSGGLDGTDIRATVVKTGVAQFVQDTAAHDDTQEKLTARSGLVSQ